MTGEVGICLFLSSNFKSFCKLFCIYIALQFKTKMILTKAFYYSEITLNMSEPVKQTKKPFDKAAWRQKKYSHGHKVEQWKDKQKMSMARSYHKMLKKDEKKALYAKGGGRKDNPNLEPIGNKKSWEDQKEKSEKPVKAGFNRAKRKYDEKVMAKQKKQDEVLKRQKEK